MADIEERAEKYPDDLAKDRPYRVSLEGIRLIRIRAYLAELAQTQHDYVAYMESQKK